jgi:2-dehydropantoate 2-reductase
MSEILIVGTGALATLFAARLSGAGHSVCMLGSWPNGLQSLQARGARLVDGSGKERAYSVQATNDPHQIGACKLALVLVKAWQTERAARQLSECLAADGLAVTLQNGIGNRETLIQALGPGRVALGTTTTGATLLGPGLARAGGEGSISIERHPALGPLEEALRSAHFDLRLVEDARSLIWGKLVINAAINPLTALLRVTNGELLKRPAARGLMAELAQETAAIASAEKVRLPFEDPIEAAEKVARETAGNHSSMFQDVRRGAPTEIDAICGAVAERGIRHGIPTPANHACWRLVQALAGGR